MKRRLLLVDDEVDVLNMTSELLALSGFEVLKAQSGPEALAILRADSAVDMVVTDHSMPQGMTGLQLADVIAQEYPALPVVLVSGYARAQLPPIPASVAFLPKPYRVAQLLQLLEPLAS